MKAVKNLQPNSIAWNIVGVVAVVPLAALIVQTFAVRWFYPDVVPNEWNPSALWDVLGRSDVLSAVWASTSIAMATTGVALLVGLPAAWYLATKPVPGRTAIFAALLAPQFLPPLTSGIGLNIAFLQVGLSNGTIPIILAHLVPVLPYVVGIAAVTFSRLDRGYLEVASGLGLSPAQRWRRVVLPMTWLGVERAAFIGFIVSWSQYLLTLLVGGGRVITLPMLLLSSGSGSNMSLFAALALLTAAVPIGVFLLAQKDTFYD